jgi:hypothetical protein
MRTHSDDNTTGIFYTAHTVYVYRYNRHILYGTHCIYRYTLLNVKLNFSGSDRHLEKEKLRSLENCYHCQNAQFNDKVLQKRVKSVGVPIRDDILLDQQ